MSFFSLRNNFNIVILPWKIKFHLTGKRKLLKVTDWHLYLHIRTSQPLKILEKEKTTFSQKKYYLKLYPHCFAYSKIYKSNFNHVYHNGGK